MQSTYDKIQFYKLGQKEREEIIKKLKKALANQKRIQLAMIFGSLTTRDYIRDIDVCIHSNPKLKFNELLDLNAKIELDLGIPVDLVELENLTPTLQTSILRNGIIIKGRKTRLDKLVSQANTQ
jgi:predicted nucleotidyltransferase